MLEVPKESSKYVPSQRFVGMQVIDSKGVLVGNVKDVSADFQNRAIAFRVITKSRTELDVSWDDVLSVEDVVLLKKEMDAAALTSQAVAAPSAPTTPVQAMVICPSCGASAPSHAKFCPKCGSLLK